MKSVGLFEAKTKLSELCQEVASSGEAYVITRCGEPLVRLEPIRDPNSARASIWERRKRHLEEYGLLEPGEQDFEVPSRLSSARPDPLA